MQKNMMTPFQIRYRDYLSSNEWLEVTKAVKQRAGFRCQVCNSSEKLQAHHRTYANLFHELEHLDDLIALCDNCHGKFHSKPRMSRISLAKRSELAIEEYQEHRRMY